MPDTYVIDATMGARGGLLCFCPVKLGEDGSIVSIITGMNFLGSMPVGGKLVAIVHEGGQDAVEAFCERHADLLTNVQNGEAR